MKLRGLLITAILTARLAAAEYHISPTGDDSSPGTSAQPWKTFGHATPLLVSGDTLFLHAGVFPERLILTGKSGGSQSPILIRNRPSETPVIDGSTLTVPTGGRAGLVVLMNCNHVHLQGIEVRNFVTAAANRIPTGIQIEGSGSGVRVTDCKVHHIHQNNATEAGNGFGISVYGTAATPIDRLVLENNEIYELRTGQSESVVLNGNVTNFSVVGNHVHHCNNIGIDFIGYEGSAPPAVDRARDGVCRGNLVHDIDSAFNPGYGGDFTNGGGDQSAAGIYIDGGTNITVERNRVHRCNFGIELASEAPTGFTENILLLNNLLHHNYGPGLIMGGYDSARGKTRFCQVRNNTLFRNDSRRTYGGQIALQFYLENNHFKNNILWADTLTKQMIIHYVEGGTAAQRTFPAGNIFDYNSYFCEGAAGDIEFGLNPTGSGGSQGNKSYNGLAAWRAAIGGEASSAFRNPGFITAVPSGTPVAGDFQLAASSHCIDAGEPSPPYVPAASEKDFFGSSRVANSRVDTGCDEFLDNLQSWRDIHFSLPDGGPGAGDLDDPDDDLVRNLIEYSQGMNPTRSDAALAPTTSLTGEVLRFTYRKNAAELIYAIEKSANLSEWSTSSLTEQTDGDGNFWRELPITKGPGFLRLAVSR
jgi:Right handed beta helix region